MEFARLFKNPAQEGTVQRLGQDLAQLPVTLATLPFDILTNPQSVTDAEGKVNLGAIFSQNERDRFALQRKQNEAMDKLRIQQEVMNGIDKISSALQTPSAVNRQALSDSYARSGVFDPQMLADLATGAADVQGMATNAAVEAGAPQGLADIADINSAQQLGQSRFQGDVTQETQAKAFGQRKQLQDERIAAQQARADSHTAAPEDQSSLLMLQDMLANGQIPKGSRRLAESALEFGNVDVAKSLLKTPPTSVTERRDQKKLKNLRMLRREGQIPPEMKQDVRAALRSRNADAAGQILTARSRALFKPPGDNWLGEARDFMQRPDFAALPAEQRQAIGNAVARNDNTPLKAIMPAIYKRQTGLVDALLRNPEYRKIEQESADIDMAMDGVKETVRASAPPDKPGYIDPTLFGPYLGRLSRENQLLWARQAGYGDDWIARKQKQWTAASDSLARALKSRMGGHASDQDLELIRSAWVTGDEPSAVVFDAKTRAIEAFQTRQREIAERRAERLRSAMSSGNVDRLTDPLGDEEMRGASADLARKLAEINSNPDLMPDTPLTPEQMQEMGR